MSKPIVLITGVSGFVGSHVVLEFLRQGYAVRGTARSARLASLQPISEKYPDFTLVHVEDVSKGDLTDSLKGQFVALARRSVAGVIHVASPLVGRASPEDSLISALDGTLNVLRQAVAAGVNKVVVTSSWATTLDPGGKQSWEGVTFTSSDYGRATKEDLLSGKHDAVWVYQASKIIAEEAAWEFASSHPQLDLTTLNPPFIYGPLAPGFPPPRVTELGTLGLIYAALSGELPLEVGPLFCDIRDVARAHVAAFESTATPTSGNRKRYLVCGGIFTWKDMVEYLGKAHPELRPRLPSLDKFQPLPGPISTIDARPAAEDLGMVDYIQWEKSVEDAVQSLLEVEKTWQKAE
ncbi:putative secondary metabolism biosynthetic enzyme [Tephrocybe rancida]|nr:putative secondary metabolism biosynthetic enzyme [Tephrocybe rancida]